MKDEKVDPMGMIMLLALPPLIGGTAAWLLLPAFGVHMTWVSMVLLITVLWAILLGLMRLNAKQEEDDDE